MAVVTDVPVTTGVENATMASIAAEATTFLNNLTTHLVDTVSTISQNDSTTILPANSTEILKLPEDDDSIHRNPELKYFSTVIIIFMGLTILIVPVFCFVGFVCARARVFTTFSEAASRGWGFRDLSVPYSEFGSEDYPKDAPKSSEVPAPASSSSGRICDDVKILVADDNHVPSSRSNRKSSFFRINSPDEDEDISSLPPTFVHSPA